MAGLAPDAAHFFKFLFVLVLYTFAMTLFVSVFNFLDLFTDRLPYRTFCSLALSEMAVLPSSYQRCLTYSL